MTSQFKERPRGKFITHRPWGTYTANIKGLLGEVTAECRQRELQDPEHTPLLGFVGRVLWGSWARLVNSSQKE